jgi:ketosteroid isomerase-like protein
MDASNARKAIEDGGRKLGEALTAKDFAAAAALYTDNGQVLPPDGPIITGRAAIGEFWQGAATALGIVSATLKTEEVISTGDLATEVGTAVLKLVGGEAKVKFVVVWQRGTDGTWRLHRDIWNGMPA